MLWKCFRIFLLLFVEHEYSVSSDTGQQPKFPGFHYNRAFVWDLNPKFIMKCLVLSLRGVRHSARAETTPDGRGNCLQLLSSLNPLLLRSSASGEPRTATSKFTFASPPVGGLSTTRDISFAHVNGGKLHACIESKQSIIQILVSVPLDEFNLLREGFWLW